jgi:hypothetical protein
MARLINSKALLMGNCENEGIPIDGGIWGFEPHVIYVGYMWGIPFWISWKGGYTPPIYIKSEGNT